MSAALPVWFRSRLDAGDAGFVEGIEGVDHSEDRAIHLDAPLGLTLGEREQLRSVLSVG